MLKQTPIETMEFHDLSDLLFLAWRKEFVYSKASNNYTHNHDFLLIEIAKTEELLRSNPPDSEYDILLEKQTLLLNALYAPYYGGNPNAETYEDLVYSMNEIGHGLGWETALKEIYSRFPNQLEKQLETRGRHWKRATYFLIVKNFSKPFFDWVVHVKHDKNDYVPPQYLGFNNLKFSSNDGYMQALNLTVNPPSDEIIFQTFIDVFDNQSHRHNALFKAVNKQTDLRLLGSVKALERSLAKGRNASNKNK